VVGLRLEGNLVLVCDANAMRGMCYDDSLPVCLSVCHTAVRHRTILTTYLCHSSFSHQLQCENSTETILNW